MGGYNHYGPVTFDLETNSPNDTSMPTVVYYNEPERYQGNRKQRRAQAARDRKNRD